MKYLISIIFIIFYTASSSASLDSPDFSNIKKNGLLVFDDSSLYFDYNVPKDSFKGHPGPSKVVNELLGDNRLKYLGGIGHNNIFEIK